MNQCPSVNPATGNRCTRIASGHDDHETQLSDGVIQTWRVVYQGTFHESEIQPVRRPIGPVVGKDGTEY